MKKRTKEEVKEALNNKVSMMTAQRMTIEDLQMKLKLREKLIEEQRSHIELLKTELNKKKWWRIW